MDKLEEIFKIQKKFTEHFFKEKVGIEVDTIKDNKFEKIKWNKEYILALIVEATEILNEVDWKMHKSTNQTEDNNKILEESIDVMKFLFGLMIINGFSLNQIYNKFKEKSDIVEKRFKKSNNE